MFSIEWAAIIFGWPASVLIGLSLALYFVVRQFSLVGSSGYSEATSDCSLSSKEEEDELKEGIASIASCESVVSLAPERWTALMLRTKQFAFMEEAVQDLLHKHNIEDGSEDVQGLLWDAEKATISGGLLSTLCFLVKAPTEFKSVKDRMLLDAGKKGSRLCCIQWEPGFTEMSRQFPINTAHFVQMVLGRVLNVAIPHLKRYTDLKCVNFVDQIAFTDNPYLVQLLSIQQNNNDSVQISDVKDVELGMKAFLKVLLKGQDETGIEAVWAKIKNSLLGSILTFAFTFVPAGSSANTKEYTTGMYLTFNFNPNDSTVQGHLGNLSSLLTANHKPVPLDSAKQPFLVMRPVAVELLAEHHMPDVLAPCVRNHVLPWIASWEDLLFVEQHVQEQMVLAGETLAIDPDNIVTVLRGRLTNPGSAGGSILAVGDLVGEAQALLPNSPTAGHLPFILKSVRDSQVAILPGWVMRQLLSKHAGAALPLAQRIATDFTLSTAVALNPPAKTVENDTPAVVAIMPLLTCPDSLARAFAQKLAKTLEHEQSRNTNDGKRATTIVLDHSDALGQLGRQAFKAVGRLRLTEWLQEEESRHHVTLLVASKPWREECVRQADLVLALYTPDSPGSYSRHRTSSIAGHQQAQFTQVNLEPTNTSPSLSSTKTRNAKGTTGLSSKNKSRTELVFLHPPNKRNAKKDPKKLLFFAPDRSVSLLPESILNKVSRWWHCRMPPGTSASIKAAHSPLVGATTMTALKLSDLHPLSTSLSSSDEEEASFEHSSSSDSEKSESDREGEEETTDTKDIDDDGEQGSSSFATSTTTGKRSRSIPPRKPFPPHSRIPRGGDREEDWLRLARRLLGTRLALVLSGGGARGLAHVGVLRALAEAGLAVDLVGGTSIGAMIGAVWAAYGHSDWWLMERRVRQGCLKSASPWAMLRDVTYPYTAVFTGAHLNNVIQDTLGGPAVHMEDCHVPFWCVTTDLSACEAVVHRRGPMWRYVRASMSIAGYFPPILDVEKTSDGVTKRILVDGGYQAALPVDVVLGTLSGAGTSMIHLMKITNDTFTEHNQ